MPKLKCPSKLALCVLHGCCSIRTRHPVTKPLDAEADDTMTPHAAQSLRGCTGAYGALPAVCAASAALSPLLKTGQQSLVGTCWHQIHMDSHPPNIAAA